MNSNKARHKQSISQNFSSTLEVISGKSLAWNYEMCPLCTLSDLTRPKNLKLRKLAKLTIF